MKPTILIGIALIILGIVALAYQGITYKTREKIVDIRPLQATAEKEKNRASSAVVRWVGTSGWGCISGDGLKKILGDVGGRLNQEAPGRCKDHERLAPFEEPSIARQLINEPD